MKRFEVRQVRLDPTTGSEMRKSRPCVVVSPDMMNARLHTVIVAPLTRGGFSAPFRVPCQFAGVSGQIALDHLRAVDRIRLLRPLGMLEAPTASKVPGRLAEMFAE